ncbi:MAG: glycosyltransferase family 2 protein [Deltaproteobacteria bacterium]|nr:glycosyltransferase family 2 protein [Deltaproteobacteria bacterium]
MADPAGTAFSIVIPAYNEEDALGPTLDRCLALHADAALQELCGTVEVIVVNDGSRDRTRDVVLAKGDGVRLVEHEHNRGYGAALKTGFRAARGDLLGFLDADGTCDPQQFAALLRTLRDAPADLVVGMRLTAATQMPFVRRVGNRFYATLITALTGRPVRDAASGMRVFRRDILAGLYPLPNGLSFTTAMSTKAIHEHLKVEEVPIPYAERAGRSKLNVLRDGLQFLRVILTLVLLYNPLKLFSVVAVLLFLGALGLLALPLWDWIMGRALPEGFYIYRTLGAASCVAGAVTAFSVGLSASLLMETLYRPHGQFGSLARLAVRTRLPQRLGLLGGMLLGGGLAVYAIFAWEHFFGVRPVMHWKWFAAASVLVITGIQLLATWLIVKLLEAHRQMRDAELR